ncbi:MAG: alkyl/aryl-sulfatase [Maricaulaceae bacterium]
MFKKISLLSASLLALSACANDTPTKIAEPEARQSVHVSDTDFRKQEVAKDKNGVTLPKGATAQTRAAQAQARASMPKDAAKEKDFATRGFIATWPKSQIKKNKGGISIDLAANDFMTGEAPDTVNPLLWQHGEFMGLNEGLFKVTDGIYQVRGFDVANITFIESDTGYIVVDPLNAGETAAAAYELMKQHVADKPVVAVLYTHSHSDHFAGISGVVDMDDAMAGKVKIIAPEGFMNETAKEWLTAGNAMGRRAFYQFGMFLQSDERGYVGAGQGPGISLGEHNLVPPTIEVTYTGETLNVDGLDIVFQLTPGAEAPAEFNFYIPKYKAVCMAETVNAGIHNVQTLRGANVRDAKEWADFLTEAQSIFGEAESLFITHHWPRFGNEEIIEYIGKQRDAYKYLHDQTVRMMNQGLTPDEIAENLVLPESLGGEWYNRGFYGSLSHNSKAVYDKYMGWYNGMPSDLNRHIPTERAKRYVAAIGGPDAVMKVAGEAFDEGDYRWTGELLQHLVFAEPKNQDARELLADSYEQMGYQAESAVWRNIYLSAARELRQGGADVYTGGEEDYIMGGASDEQILDLLAVRLIPERAEGKRLSINVEFEETGNAYNVRLENSVLVYRKDALDPDAGTVTASRKGFLAVSLGFLTLTKAKVLRLVKTDGDAKAIQEIGEMMDKPSLDFNIIEP